MSGHTSTTTDTPLAKVRETEKGWRMKGNQGHVIKGKGKYADGMHGPQRQKVPSRNSVLFAAINVFTVLNEKQSASSVAVSSVGALTKGDL